MGARFLGFSPKALFCNFHQILLQKNYQKASQNDVRTLPKSMPRTCWFLTSIFSGFGLDFGASWASKLEPSWQFWLQKTMLGALLSHLKLNVFLNGVLECSRADFGGPRSRFWSLRASILEPQGSFFEGFWKYSGCCRFPTMLLQPLSHHVLEERSWET